jgi:hypothetical protein
LADIEIFPQPPIVVEVQPQPPIVVEVNPAALVQITQVINSAGVPLPALPAAQPLSALRLVSAAAGQYGYSDPAAADSAWGVAGLTDRAVALGESFSPIRDQPITDSSWSWIRGSPVFLGPNGTLTQVAPGTNYLVVVAKVLSPTTLFIQIEEPIKL